MTIDKLCQDLLRRTAALQLANNQADIDPVAPNLYGRSAEAVRCTQKLNGLAFRQRSRRRATTVLAFLREHPKVAKHTLPPRVVPCGGVWSDAGCSAATGRVGDEERQQHEVKAAPRRELLSSCSIRRTPPPF